MQASQLGFNDHYAETAPELEELIASRGYLLLEFGTNWCGHCQEGAVAVAEAMRSYADLLHVKVTDGKGKRLGRVYEVKLWPTLILLRDGDEVSRVVRPAAKDIKALLALIE